MCICVCVGTLCINVCINQAYVHSGVSFRIANTWQVVFLHGGYFPPITHAQKMIRKLVVWFC